MPAVIPHSPYMQVHCVNFQDADSDNKGMKVANPRADYMTVQVNSNHKGRMKIKHANIFF